MDVSRLIGMGSAWDEAMRVDQKTHKKGGGDNKLCRQCQRSGGKNNDGARGCNQAGRYSSGEHERDSCQPRFDY
jgi:hypothetical protein